MKAGNRRRVYAAAATAMLLAGLPSVGAAGPITFNTALPVHADEVIVREQVIWLRATGDSGPMDRELNVLAVPSVLVYGVHPRVTLFGVLPFLYKDIEVSTPAGRTHRTTSGFGDMTLFLRATALVINRPGETLRLAPFAGVKLPTGADDEADELGRLPQPLQLGSGSWDPFAGLIFTWQTLRWELDLSGVYSLRSKANNFDAGDEARGDASFQYRIVPWGSLGEGVPSFLFAVLESNVVWRAHDRIAGDQDPDSGGVRWYLAPGLQWVTSRTVVEASVQIPVVQELGGQTLREDFTARVSFRANF